MPRRRPRPTDPDLRFRNMLESQGLPAIAGLVRVAEQPSGPLPSQTSAPSGGVGSMVIDMGDSAVYTGWSKPFHPLTSTTLAEVVGILTAASDNNPTEANVYLNGTDLLGTLTIPTGALKSNTLKPGASLGPDDFWQVLVTQAGVGAAGLTFYGMPG